MAEPEFRRLGDEEQKQPIDYLKVIWKKKWLVLSIAVTVFGFNLWKTLRTQPLYEAATTIQLGVQVGAALLERAGPFMSSAVGLETEIEILKSRIVAEKTAIRLQRHYALRNGPGGVSVQVSGVTVGEQGRSGWYTITYTDAAGNYQVRDPDGQIIGVGQSGQPFSARDISFTISSKPSPNSGISFQVLIPNLADVANSLRGQLSITPMKGTNIISLKVRTSDPREASRLSNAFAETYVDFSREQKLQQVVGMREFLERQLQNFRQDMTKTQEELAEKTKKAPPDFFGRRILEQGGISSDDPRFQHARRLFELELERVKLQYTLTPNHRLIAQMDQEIATIRSRLSEQARQGKEDISLDELMREARIKISMYNYLLQKQQETRLAEASELGSARVIDRALTPKAPVLPDVSRGVRFGLLLGLSLGMGVALLLAYLDRSVKNIEQLENRLGLPVFAGIPDMLEEPRRIPFTLSNKREPSEHKKLLVTMDGARGSAAEAYRTLRTNIEFALPEASARVFLFTSAGPAEGKSITIANLAVVMTQMGKRVLILDADFRRPTQYKLFGLPRLPRQLGLTEVLAKSLPWRDVTMSTSVDNLDLLACGRVPPNPLELVSGQKIKALLQEVGEDYDLVLVDSPPILLFSDATVLSRLVSGVFLVVRAGVTTPEAIIRGRAMLDAVSAKLIGAVLNGISSADALGPYGSYHYRYYSDDEDHAEDRGKIRKTLRRLRSHFRI